MTEDHAEEPAASLWTLHLPEPWRKVRSMDMAERKEALRKTRATARVCYIIVAVMFLLLWSLAAFHRPGFRYSSNSFGAESWLPFLLMVAMAIIAGERRIEFMVLADLLIPRLKRSDLRGAVKEDGGGL